MKTSSAHATRSLWLALTSSLLVASVDSLGVLFTERRVGRDSPFVYALLFWCASFAWLVLLLVPLLSVARPVRRFFERGVSHATVLQGRPRLRALSVAILDGLPFFVVLAWLPQSWLRPRLASFGAAERLGIVFGLAAAWVATTLIALVVQRAQAGRARRGMLAGLLLIGVGAWFADRTVLVGLYPNFHYGACFVWIASTVVLMSRVDLPGLFASRFGHLGWFAPVVALAWVLGLEVASTEVYLARGSQALERLVTGGREVLDFDRDGTSAWLGGLDCEEFAASRAPSAFDIPGDGVDQDCTGGDARWRDAHRPTLPPPAVPSEPPNVVLITVDALRADHLGAYGYARPTSPNIDALAARSLRFAWAISPSPKTYDTMPGLMTGLFPSNLPRDYEARPESEWAGVGEYAYVLGGVPTLAERFRSAGYRTAGWVGATLLDRLGLGRGFERFGVTGDATERALAFLAEPSPRPFFLWLHYYGPHAPYERHERYDFGSSAVDRYDGEIAHEDAEIGRVLEGLAALGHGGRTVVVVTADHGEEFGDHGGQYHALRLYQELVRVPLIVHVPGGAPLVTDAPVSIIDVAPTLCALAGLAGGCGELDGRSLLAEAGPHRTPAYSEVFKKGRGVVLTSLVTERFHLIRDLLEERVELYDVLGDPKEHRNLAHRLPERTRELLERHTHAPLSRQAEVFAAFARDRDALALARALPSLQREALVLQALDLLEAQTSLPVAEAVRAYLETPGVSKRVRTRAHALFGTGRDLARGTPR